jgi:selenide,water dikinase
VSKPIGTGIVLAGGSPRRSGRHRSHASPEPGRGRIARDPRADVHAVTDVTGFGVCGHAWEMAERSGLTLAVDTRRLPFYEGALEAADRGVRTGGDARNREHLDGRVVADDVPASLEALCYDPQTSGGLLAALAPAAVAAATDAGFTVVGSVEPGPASVRLA